MENSNKCTELNFLLALACVLCPLILFWLYTVTSDGTLSYANPLYIEIGMIFFPLFIVFTVSFWIIQILKFKNNIPNKRINLKISIIGFILAAASFLSCGVSFIGYDTF